MWLILVYTVIVRYMGTYCFLQNALNPSIVGIDGLMKETRNSISGLLELRLSCTNPSS